MNRYIAHSLTLIALAALQGASGSERSLSFVAALERSFCRCAARERFYFVQAEPTIWNYLPANKDCVMGMELDTGDGERVSHSSASSSALFCAGVPAERSCPKFNMSSMSGGGMHGMAAAASARSLQSHKEAGHAADADADGGQQHGGTGGGMDGGMQHDASTWVRRSAHRYHVVPLHTCCLLSLSRRVSQHGPALPQAGVSRVHRCLVHCARPGRSAMVFNPSRVGCMC